MYILFLKQFFLFSSVTYSYVNILQLYSFWVHMGSTIVLLYSIQLSVAKIGFSFFAIVVNGGKKGEKLYVFCITFVVFC